jgi:hypothetical protein
MMQTFSANGIAERLERDRGTVVKALRSVPADRMVKGKLQWKISTASRAVEAHLQGLRWWRQSSPPFGACR